MAGPPPMPLYGLGPIADFSQRTARIVSKNFSQKIFPTMAVLMPNRADRRGWRVLPVVDFTHRITPDPKPRARPQGGLALLPVLV